MALLIQTNTASLRAQRNLLQNQMKLESSFDRLSSGFRINSAKDDAAGLAISESMRMQIRSLVVAERNAHDGISMAQTAEGALGEIHDILGRMRELAIQSSNGSMTSTDRSYLQSEFGLLQAEVTRIMGSASFNGKALVSTTATTVTLQVGVNNTSLDQVQLTTGGVGLTSLINGASTLVSGPGTTNALAALGVIDSALTNVSTYRARYGAIMNRMDVAISNIQTMRLNMTAANSRIRDVDIAAETSSLTKQQVLTQAGTSVLSQANQLPQLALALLS